MANGSAPIDALLQILGSSGERSLDLEFILYHTGLVSRAQLSFRDRPFIFAYGLKVPPHPYASESLVTCIQLLRDVSLILETPSDPTDYSLWPRLDSLNAALFLSLKYMELCHYVLQDASVLPARYRLTVLKQAELRADQLIRISLEKFNDEVFAFHFGSFLGRLRVWHRACFRSGLLCAEGDKPAFEFSLSLRSDGIN